MKRSYILSIFVFAFIFTVQSYGQRYVHIEATSPEPADIFKVIMGDTTDTGERVDNNTIYQLDNGKVYITSNRLVNKPEWDLQIEAVDLTDTKSKAIITRIPNASGKYKDIMRAQGNVTLRNLWIISGEKGPLEQHDWGKIRMMSENTTLRLDNCIIEKDRGGFFQIRANGIKAFVTNCILRNGGNRRILQGNGRGFECRNYTLDTVIMRNTIVHNIQDRFFRSQGASAPHNYIEIDHCTSFNTIGRHGFIQLGRVIEAKITNNLFINPIMLGTSPIYTDEQTQPDNDKHKVITLDTLFDNTVLTISNNNIFWTNDVTEYWATNDSVSAPDVLSDLVIDNLGDKASNAYFQENITLNSIPGSVLQYVKDLYADPTSQDMYDFIVEDIALAGTAYDSGNLFDFSTFDPCYSPTSISAKAATDGGAIGAINLCPGLSAINEIGLNPDLDLEVFPNPLTNELNIAFDLKKNSDVTISILDLNGRTIKRKEMKSLSAGSKTFSQNISNFINRGMYLVSVKTEFGSMFQKIIVQ